MPGIVRHSCFFLILATSLTSWGQISSTNPESSNFEVLGLKLGMTAQEASQVVQEHLKVPASDLKMDVTPRHYLRNGTYVDVCVVSNDQLELTLEFSEVFPGKGAGSEALYKISYVPRTMFVEDRGEFSERVLAKYGQPAAVRNRTMCIWVPPEYRSPEDALRAGAPLLELDKSLPKLYLTNPAIRRRMEDAFHDVHKVPL